MVITFFKYHILIYNTMNVIGFNRFHLTPIHIKCSMWLISVDFHVCHGVASVDETPACYIYHWFGVPLCLVEIVYVLACFAVVGNHTFVIHAITVALMSYAALHVTELPNTFAP